MKYAIIKDGVVINVALADSALEDNWVLSATAAIGDLYADGQFTKPVPVVDPLAYQAERAAEYPSIGDQLDALWKGGEAATAMLAQVQAVKAKYPKSE